LKARLAAGGHQQERELAGEVSGPTAQLSSVLIVAAVAAKEQRVVATMDIGSAYLNADIKAVIYMRLDPDQTRMLAELEPRYRVFIRSNGTLVMRLRKALYGCLQSALLWNQHLVSTLRSIGFKENAADLCVLNRGEPGADGSQTTVAVYVDDLLVTVYKEKDIQDLKTELERVYNTVAEHRGVKLPYLGMLLDYLVPGEVKITMQKYIDDVLELAKVRGQASTPATLHLFDVDE
jgi:hypothetical protein